MKRPIDTPIPLPDVPPFWAPIPAAERSLYGSVTPADRLAEASGFTPARFIISRAKDGVRTTVVGYVRDSLAIFSAQVAGHVVATVVHLPTGVGMVQTLGDDAAFFVVDLIRALRPWGAVPDLEGVTAEAPAVIERIESVGLRLTEVAFKGGSLSLWVHAQPSTTRRAS
jgi:hypothetical protein